jgi:1-deoxyxylulose-5-phosphate synthase
MCDPLDHRSAGSAALGIGTVALSVAYGPPGVQRPAPHAAQARRVLLSAIERGVRVIDTAPAYGESETLVGQALGDRDGCTIATKLAIPDGGWDLLSPAETRAYVRSSAQASLQALRRGHLDLLQIHNADEPLIRRMTVVEALARLREEGLVARIGATLYGEAAALAAIDTAAFDVVQIAYSALDRRPERRVLPAAASAGKAVIARSLLLRGVLSPAGRELGGAFAVLGRAADAVRRSLHVSWEQLPGAAVAFVASQPGIACALLGPRDERELDALLDQVERFAPAAAGLRLPTSDLPEQLLDPSYWPTEVSVDG